MQANVHRVTARCAVRVDRGGDSKELLLYIKNTKRKWGRVVANITLQIARNRLPQVSHGDSECSRCNGNKLEKKIHPLPHFLVGLAREENTFLAA